MTGRRRIDLAPLAPGSAAGRSTPSDTPNNSQHAVSDFASKLASKTDTNQAEPAGYGLPDLVAGPVDPDLDLVPLNVRVPRYLAEALDAQVRLRRGRKQEIVSGMLRGGLDPVIVEVARRKAEQR